jgi:serine/threonine-protein kinase
VASRGSGFTAAGRPYLAFEALEGRRLHYELAGGLSTADAIDAMCQLLAALSYLHGLGLVHRDVRPENILLGQPHGTLEAGAARKVMLLHFGLVQIGTEDAIPGQAIAVPFGERIYRGSPHFAAPEQASGGLVDARADIYAVGAVLYTLLTGGYLFDACRTEDEMREAQLHSLPAPPSERQPGASSADLDRIIMRVLAKDPNARPGTAGDLLELLERVRGRSVVPAPAHASPVQEGLSVVLPNVEEPQAAQAEGTPLADPPSLDGPPPNAVPSLAEPPEPLASSRRSLAIFVLAVVTIAVAVMLGVGWTLLRFFL